MKKEYQNIISRLVGFLPVKINSALVSAQNRNRLYWSDLSIKQPEDRNILLKDIVCNDVLFNGAVRGRYLVDGVRQDGHIPSLLLSNKALEYMDRIVKDGRNHWDFKHHSNIKNDKSSTVVANFFKGVPYNVLKDWNCIRKFDPIECERLQTFPDNYTQGVSNTQRYKQLGNSWTVAVIVEIFKELKC